MQQPDAKEGIGPDEILSLSNLLCICFFFCCSVAFRYRWEETISTNMQRILRIAKIVMKFEAPC